MPLGNNMEEAAEEEKEILKAFDCRTIEIVDYLVGSYELLTVLDQSIFAEFSPDNMGVRGD